MFDVAVKFVPSSCPTDGGCQVAVSQKQSSSMATVTTDGDNKLCMANTMKVEMSKGRRSPVSLKRAKQSSQGHQPGTSDRIEQ